MRSTDRLLNLLNGYQNTCVLVAAARLNVFEELADEPRSSSDLANKLGVPVESFSRLVSALRCLGMVQDKLDVLHLTEDGAFFLKGRGTGDILTLIDGQYLRAWHELAASVTSGEAAFKTIFGKGAWEHRRDTPHLNEAFNRFNERPQRRAVREVLDNFDFSSYGTVVDLGGGNGYLVSGILERHPEVYGILFDQPHVIDGAAELVSNRSLAERCRLVPGSFFERVPDEGDLYVLQHILHDWNDEECAHILRTCRASMKPGAELLILEKILPSEDPPLFLVLRDLHMMTVLGGRERTRSQYEQLLTTAGFGIDAVTTLPPTSPDIMLCSLRGRS